jgi:hypothetical protein
MARLPLLGGAYSARWVGANAQRCINLYPELNPKDALVPVTHYQRPGLRLLAQGPVAPVRGLYRASNGQGYCVIGQNVYQIGPPPGWALTLLGQLAIAGTNLTSMIDNGTTAVLVDNSPLGYTINLATGAFAQINDPTGIFAGGRKVDYIDTFILWAPINPGSNAFGSTLSNEITFDALYIAGKTDYPDPLQTLIVNRHEIMLMGQLKSEQWYDAGNATFPFAELPGAYIEHGIVAPYSLASQDISVFWLSQDLQGQGIVLRQRGYDTTRISNHALEYAIRKMAQSVGIADAIAYTYQSDGHVFYVLTFPAGDQTWVFDDSLGGNPQEAWHQRAWADQQGVLHRERANCGAFINGQFVVGDWQNGALYALDPDCYTDNGQAIQFLRSFPFVAAGENAGSARPIDYKRAKYNGFWADVQTGDILAPDGTAGVISLRWSDSRGKTWGNPVIQRLGGPGEYNVQPQWLNLGVGRGVYRVFELSYSVMAEAALNGAWVEAEVMSS